MHLYKLLLQRKYNIAIFVLSLLVWGISIYPLLLSGIKGAFFSIDPDIVYLANALSYVRQKVMWYHDHPGIPSIYVIAQSLMPLRIYSKFIQNQDFIDFVFNNYFAVVYYLRMFQSLIFVLGLNIFLHAVYRSTKKFTMVILATLLLINYASFLNIPWSISAESLNFLLISLWILIFSIYIQSENKLALSFMYILTGLLLANRATNFVYFSSVLIILIMRRKEIIKNLTFLIGGFLAGIFPLIDRVDVVIKRMLFFAGASGVHGGSPGKIIDLNLYLDSLRIFWDRDLVFSVLVITSSLLVLAMKSKISRLFFYICISLILTILIFAKFPLQHYQMPNLLFLVFCFVVLVKELKGLKIALLVFVLSYYSIQSIVNYNNLATKEIRKTVALENFIVNNPHSKGELWEWARSKNFSYLWTNSYGNNIFDVNLKKANIRIYSGDANLFEVCWDHLYLQNVTYTSSELFLNKSLNVTHVPEVDDIVLIESKHCVNSFRKEP